MLAPFAGETRLAGTREVINLVNALTLVQAGAATLLRKAVINIGIAQVTAPAGVTHALVSENQFLLVNTRKVIRSILFVSVFFEWLFKILAATFGKYLAQKTKSFEKLKCHVSLVSSRCVIIILCCLTLKFYTTRHDDDRYIII